MSESEARGVISKGMYWREVARRDLKAGIMGKEHAEEVIKNAAT